MTTKKTLINVDLTRLLLIGVIALGFISPSFGNSDDHEKADEHGHAEAAKEQAGKGAGEDAHEDEEGVVRLNADKLVGLHFNIVKVRKGSLSQTIELTGEVNWNAERVTHVVPRVPGVVRKVYKSLGDTVKEGDVLALLASRELATVKAAYLTALAREQLALTNFNREEKLWKQQVSAERDYLESQNALAEAKIVSRLTQLQLHAIGLSEADVQAISQSPDSELSLYRMTTPLAGVIVERHITRGEMLKDDSQTFLIVDPSEVWVMGRAYERDLRLLHTGQKATVRLDAFPGEQFEGTVDYIASQLDPETRTVEVRVVLANPEQRFREGMFGMVSVFGTATDDKTQQPTNLLVPRDAVQPVKDGFVVFRKMEDPGEFKMIPVQVRGKSKEFVWVEGELRAGDGVAIGDTFVLKSEAAKKEMGGGHGH